MKRKSLLSHQSTGTTISTTSSLWPAVKLCHSLLNFYSNIINAVKCLTPLTVPFSSLWTWREIHQLNPILSASVLSLMASVICISTISKWLTSSIILTKIVMVVPTVCVQLLGLGKRMFHNALLLKIYIDISWWEWCKTSDIPCIQNTYDYTEHVLKNILFKGLGLKYCEYLFFIHPECLQLQLQCCSKQDAFKDGTAALSMCLFPAAVKLVPEKSWLHTAFLHAAHYTVCPLHLHTAKTHVTNKSKSVQI
jgi:hypothetical protein